MRIVYLHGFASGPASTKARFFLERLEAAGHTVAVPDLSEGDFEHLTITGQLKVIERTVAGERVTLFGSSMGGYLAALYASQHSNVERLVLLAPAFGFVRRWLGALGPDAEEWERTGLRSVYHYGERLEMNLSYNLIRDALQFDDNPDFRQPALILHGRQDPTVPAEASVRFVAAHPNCRLVLLDSGHELTDSLERLWSETSAFLSTCGDV
jgi:pimeloyl-ACP methyl ester carboxylesterase